MPSTKNREPAADEPLPPIRQEFLHLFERYAHSVNYFFAHRGCSPEECEDLTQETFLGAYRGIDSFRREASSGTWLFKIAGNIWRNTLRHRSASKRQGQAVPLDENPGTADRAQFWASDDPYADTLHSEQLALLRPAVEELPPKMRRHLRLRIRGYSNEEIANLMKVNINTVKSQISQAKERLKKRLNDQSTQPEDGGQDV